MFNFIRRFLPDWLSPDPSVDSLIANFNSTMKELEIQSERFCSKADQQKSIAQHAELAAKRFENEAARASQVAARIQAIIQ